MTASGQQETNKKTHERLISHPVYVSWWRTFCSPGPQTVKTHIWSLNETSPEYRPKKVASWQKRETGGGETGRWVIQGNCIFCLSLFFHCVTQEHSAHTSHLQSHCNLSVGEQAALNWRTTTWVSRTRRGARSMQQSHSVEIENCDL